MTQNAIENITHTMPSKHVVANTATALHQLSTRLRDFEDGLLPSLANAEVPEQVLQQIDFIGQAVVELEDTLHRLAATMPETERVDVAAIIAPIRLQVIKDTLFGSGCASKRPHPEVKSTPIHLFDEG